jgi:hypothetical protein
VSGRSSSADPRRRAPIGPSVPGTARQRPIDLNLIMPVAGGERARHRSQLRAARAWARGELKLVASCEPFARALLAEQARRGRWWRARVGQSRPRPWNTPSSRDCSTKGTAMSSHLPSDTVHGPAVATEVTFPASASATLRSTDDPHPIELTPEQVVQLFAVGLRLPEPDRTGWVQIGEIDVDDTVGFRIGVTGIDGDVALQALRRGIEWALRHSLELAIEEEESTTRGGGDHGTANDK